MSSETHIHMDSHRDTLGAGREGCVGTDQEQGMGEGEEGGGRGEGM